MMRLTILFLVLLSGCTTIKPPAAVHVKTKPQYIFDPSPARIVLLHTCDVPAKKYRNNKEDLFIRFLDSILVTAAVEIKERTGIPTEIIRGQTNLGSNTDSSINLLLQKHAATHAIIVDSFNVYFNQTNVAVTKTNSGKEREAFYDIVSEVDFSLYDDRGLFKQQLMKKAEYHSSRSVASGLLAAGPNVVSQRKDAWNITNQNLINYLNLFFEGR